VRASHGLELVKKGKGQDKRPTGRKPNVAKPGKERKGREADRMAEEGGYYGG